MITKEQVEAELQGSAEEITRLGFKLEAQRAKHAKWVKLSRNYKVPSPQPPNQEEER